MVIDDSATSLPSVQGRGSKVAYEQDEDVGGSIRGPSAPPSEETSSPPDTNLASLSYAKSHPDDPSVRLKACKSSVTILNDLDVAAYCLDVTVIAQGTPAGDSWTKWKWLSPVPFDNDERRRIVARDLSTRDALAVHTAEKSAFGLRSTEITVEYGVTLTAEAEVAFRLEFSAPIDRRSPQGTRSSLSINSDFFIFDSACDTVEIEISLPKRRKLLSSNLNGGLKSTSKASLRHTEVGLPPNQAIHLWVLHDDRLVRPLLVGGWIVTTVLSGLVGTALYQALFG